MQSEAKIFSFRKFTNPALAQEAEIVIVFSSLLYSLCIYANSFPPATTLYSHSIAFFDVIEVPFFMSAGKSSNLTT